MTRATSRSSPTAARAPSTRPGSRTSSASTTVVVPPVAGLFSAVGLLFARPEFHEVRSCHLDVDAVDPETIVSLFDEMEEVLTRAFAGRAEPEWARTADLRYGGQSWEIEVELPDGPVDRQLLAALRARFEDEHELLYGVRGRPGSPVEVRARAARRARPRRPRRRRSTSPTRSFANGSRRGGCGSAASARRCRCGRAPRSAPEPEPGPLLVDEYDTTVVVPQRLDACDGISRPGRSCSSRSASRA